MRYLIVLLLAAILSGCEPPEDTCSRQAASMAQTRFAYAVVYQQCMKDRGQ